MSFMRTLDEFSSEELVVELLRREELVKQNKCAYCEQPRVVDDVGWKECKCRFGGGERYHPRGILKKLT